MDSRFVYLLLFFTAVSMAWTKAAQGQATAPAQQFVRLMVIAPEEFLPPLRNYLAKRPPEVIGELVSLKAVLAEGQGRDDAEKIKRWLFEKWHSEKFNHVLLVGDADVFPVRYMVLDRVTEPAFDYAFYPSDLYYGDLCKQDGSFESWNAITDDFHGGYFGEVRGEKNKSDPINFDRVDYLPEVGVGRWPVSTVSELETVITKSLAYESAIIQREENDAGRAGFV
ncbi:MAG: C25 family cysteine peptidase, partial [Planctomycetota bacterium]